jgi:hypothetical protein
MGCNCDSANPMCIPEGMDCPESPPSARAPLTIR